MRLIVLAVVVVAILVALLMTWRWVYEIERGDGSPSLTRQRTLIGWAVLVVVSALRWLVFWA